MKTLLLNNFAILHHKVPETISITERSIYGVVGMKDNKACRSCIPFFANSCEQEVFKINAKTPISVINIEEYVDKFRIEGRRCDYLLYDTNHIAFVDLTCSMEEYLYPHHLLGEMQQGKRLTARKQIEHTIELLTEEPEIAEYIEAKSKKIGLLAYRIKDEDLFVGVPKQLQKEIETWQAMEMEMETKKLKFQMSHGFSFEMIRYPEEYNW